jgi:2-isopropylmalate synthase
VFISTSDLHIREKLRTTREEVLSRIRSSIRRARQFTDDIEFSAEDASRTDQDFLCQVVETAIEEGATTINLPDTVGYATPAEYGAMFRQVGERVPGCAGIVLSAHCHDDLGLAVANTLAAVQAASASGRETPRWRRSWWRAGCEAPPSDFTAAWTLARSTALASCSPT